MLSKDLREQAMKVINYEKKEMIPLTDEEKESYENQNICYICEKEFSTEKKYCKVRDCCHYTRKYRGAAHSICNLRCKIPREFPVVFHNGSTYDYHFIIEKLAKEFQGSFDCLGENTEKYITFSVSINIEHDNGKTVTYKLKFIDSSRFMASSLSSLVDNLCEINNENLTDEFIGNIRSITTLLSHSVDNLSEINKKLERSENKFTDNLRSISSSLSHSVDNLSVINKKIEKSENKFINSFRSMSSLLLSLVNDLSVINNKKIELENKFIDNFRSMLASLSHCIDKISEINKKLSLIELSEKFHNTYQLCNKDLNKFALLLRKGVYLMKIWIAGENLRKLHYNLKKHFKTN